MIHIHDGDVSREAAERGGVEGEHYAFREALVDGPTPAGISDDDWIEIRARHLSGAYCEDLDQMREFWEDELAMIEDLFEEDALTFWFDTDLFCQVNLMFLLERFQSGGYEASCTIVESHCGDPESFEHSIRHVAPDLLDAYSRAWRAYGSSDPSSLDELLLGEVPEPLRNALDLHRRRFPSRRNGLGGTEQSLAEIVAAQEGSSFAELFRRFSEKEPGHGLGDAQVWSRIRSLSSDPAPLFAIQENADPLESWVSLTEAGTAVLHGTSDAIALRGIDRWLGGVHLTPSNLWRYEGGVLFAELAS